jgi:hypothetical protein
VAGVSILPSDFSSRNAPDCDDSSCQICTFVHRTEDSVVRHMSTSDVLDGSVNLQFTSRSAWLANQLECLDLRRTRAHLRQGTRPSKKLTNVRDVKRYLNAATLSKDGLLVVKRDVPFAPSRECIIVPRQVLDGLLTSLHLTLDHPSCHQMKSVVHRFFYALDMDKSIESITSGCHRCVSLRKVPHVVQEQSTCDPPEAIGNLFAADVIKRERQFLYLFSVSVLHYLLPLCY